MNIKDSRVSIIIPAYNESAVISSALTSFLESDFLDNNQVIVVCNGCTDETAKIVRQLSPKIICLETDTPSKTNALNMGDSVAMFYPRIYLDADVSISVTTVNEMIKTLNREGTFATSVAAKMDLSSSSWAVKAFYDIWLNLPYCKAGMIGSGVYVLSKQGRSRFQKFPNIIADDGYIRCLFKESERPLTLSYYAIVTAPRDLISLIKITTRSRLGRYELQEKFPELLSNESKDYKAASVEFLLNFMLWPKTIVYVGVNIITRMRAKYQYSRNMTIWERDESSRY